MEIKLLSICRKLGWVGLQRIEESKRMDASPPSQILGGTELSKSPSIGGFRGLNPAINLKINPSFLQRPPLLLIDKVKIDIRFSPHPLPILIRC